LTFRDSWLHCWLVFLACQAVAFSDDDAEPGRPAPQDQRPVGSYDDTVARQPGATRSQLNLAAEQLEQGNPSAACELLGSYLKAHPWQLPVRWQYAELLAALERREQARLEYQRFLAQAQERGSETERQRIQCHLRLMQLAEAEDDEYSRRLHRGLGLYLLALQRLELGDAGGELPVEGLLCRAAGELTTAHLYRPDAAQPCWYLHKVWSALGQRATALRWLERTHALAPFTYLTPTEQHGLALALRLEERRALRP